MASGELPAVANGYLPSGARLGVPPVRERVLVQVITGGRPLLKDRPSRLLLPKLRELGWDTEWCVREDHAPEYEQGDGSAAGDGRVEDPSAAPLNVYPLSFANAYAKSHWRHQYHAFEPDGFMGAFPGREWAMRSGAERGYDLVLQLDDNIINVGPISSQRPSYAIVTSEQESFSLVAHFAMSTNAALCGLQLSSIVPKKSPTVIRPGFPYSAFFEKTGAGRLPYYGPFEDDIMHALEYGLHGGPGRAVGIVEALTYAKESTSTSGMRKFYNPKRGLEIARRYPRNVSLSVGRRTSSPNDTSQGVRHWLTTTGFTPIRVSDRPRFDVAEARLRGLLAEAIAESRSNSKQKMKARAEGGAWSSTQVGAHLSARDKARREAASQSAGGPLIQPTDMPTTGPVGGTGISQ